MCFTVVAGHNHIEIRLPSAPLLPSSKPISFMDKYESTSDISTCCVPLFPTQAMLPFVTTVQVFHAGVHAGYLAVAIFFRWKQHISHTNCAWNRDETRKHVTNIEHLLPGVLETRIGHTKINRQLHEIAKQKVCEINIKKLNRIQFLHYNI